MSHSFRGMISLTKDRHKMCDLVKFLKYFEVPELFMQQLQSIRGMISLTEDRHKMSDNHNFFQDPDISKFVQVQNLSSFQLAFLKEQGLENSIYVQ